jgi:Icc-related predicted phosphoesterase
MRLLLFSDLHRDLSAARAITQRAREVDVVVGAGDYATMREGLEDVINELRAIDRPTVLVSGNSESVNELRLACDGWATAHVLHGESVDIGDVIFFGLGCAVPTTPFGAWSVDLDEGQAAGLLDPCPPGAVLVSHSPPHGHVDRSSTGQHLGSVAVLGAIRLARPALVVCGHIHDAWGQRSDVDGVPVLNAGPAGVIVDLGPHVLPAH